MATSFFYFFIEKNGTIFGGEEVIGSVGWEVSGWVA